MPTHDRRLKYIEALKQHDHFANVTVGLGKMQFIDQAAFQHVLDIPGNGYSGRSPLRFLLGSTVWLDALSVNSALYSSLRAMGALRPRSGRDTEPDNKMGAREPRTLASANQLLQTATSLRSIFLFLKISFERGRSCCGNWFTL